MARSARHSESTALPHDALVRSIRRCRWALVLWVAFFVVAAHWELGIVQSGWSLTLGQASIQATVPLKRPLPTSYAIRNESFARVSGLPVEQWPHVTPGVVLFVSLPLWMLGVYPVVRIAWCAHRLATVPAIAKCERCGYDLSSARTAACPECGWKRDWLRAFRRGLFDRL